MRPLAPARDQSGSGAFTKKKTVRRPPFSSHLIITVARKPSTAISAGRHQELTTAQLKRCLLMNRQRVYQLSWESKTPEEQRRIRQIVDAAAITLRRGNG